MGAEVEPVVSAPLGMDPPTDAIGRLEHDDVAVAQRVGGGQPGDPTADDDDLAVLGHGAILGETRATGCSRWSPASAGGLGSGGLGRRAARPGDDLLGADRQRVTVTPYGDNASSIAALRIAGVASARLRRRP